jgi:hypothetical protein
MSKFDQRCKSDLESSGYLVAKTEHWNAFARRRQDLFGVFDYVAVKADEIAGVQVTSRGNMAARRKKIKKSEVYTPWLAAGGVILLIGYDKKKGRYRSKIERYTSEG